MIQSTEQAISTMQNTRLSEKDREEGIHYLRDNSSPAGIDALVAALRDDDHGVRFAAANALAFLGDSAMPALLKALAQPDCDSLLRNGAYIVLNENTSPRVRQSSGELLKALKGPQAAIATMEASVKLMPSFR